MAISDRPKAKGQRPYPLGHSKELFFLALEMTKKILPAGVEPATLGLQHWVAYKIGLLTRLGCLQHWVAYNIGLTTLGCLHV